MIVVRLYCENGVTVHVNVDSTFEVAKKYFLNNDYNVGYNTVIMTKVIKVAQLMLE